MKKVGILGGTFNPLHNAHLAIAMAAYEQYELDEVWFMPAGTPPHKEVAHGISPLHRQNMVSMGISSYHMFKLCDIEIKEKEPCYTWKTLKKLQEQYGSEVKFYFIIGGDSFFDFENWVKPKSICKSADILVAIRPKNKKHAKKDFEKTMEVYQRVYGDHFFPLKISQMHTSSTELRKKLMEGKDISGDMPEAVYHYIKEHQLFQQHFSVDDITEMEKKLKKQLKQERYVHTLGVMHTAANLAYRYGYPYESAMVAGLLHDCAKCLTDEKRLEICKEKHIPVTPMEKKHPHLLHGKVGAYLAKSKYHVFSDEILHAIEVHTTGCANMSTLDQIIFIADYIEPGRTKAPNLEFIRKKAYEDLSECTYLILKDTLEFLENKGASIDKTTIDTYQYFKDCRKEK